MLQVQTVPLHDSLPVRYVGRASQVARQRLDAAGYVALKRVDCLLHDSVVVLTGRVPSFYLKQLAQEIVRGIEHVDQIDNRIDVTRIV